MESNLGKDSGVESFPKKELPPPPDGKFEDPEEIF